MIKAIDTHYKGYKFRSRLEARVAVFLDALDASWQYEIEGFNLPVNGNYLPDFLVDCVPNTARHGYSNSFWLEVKASQPTKKEILKLRELCIETQIPGVFFIGDLNVNGKKMNAFSFICSYDEDYYGVYDEVFNYLQVPLYEYIEDVTSPEESKYFWDVYGKAFYRYYAAFIDMQRTIKSRQAAKAALSARFEFGESG